MTSHLIIIGFKHAGKTLLGERLSLRLNRPFVDLDSEIIRLHTTQCGKEQTCREILQHHGEEFFRALESDALKEILTENTPLILALGGGTPLMKRNQALLKGQQIVHVTAPRSIVFERIMINGKPAFFSQEKDAFDQFQELWEQRMPVFEELAGISVNNEGTIDSLAEEVLTRLNLAHD